MKIGTKQDIWRKMYRYDCFVVSNIYMYTVIDFLMPEAQQPIIVIILIN